jgi:hypothetical protein
MRTSLNFDYLPPPLALQLQIPIHPAAIHGGIEDEEQRVRLLAVRRRHAQCCGRVLGVVSQGIGGEKAQFSQR